MNAVLIPAVLAAVAFVLSIGWWRRRRVAAVLVGVVAVSAALVAIQDLPEPAVVALLLIALGAIAAVTAWPLLTRARRAGSWTEEHR